VVITELCIHFVGKKFYFSKTEYTFNYLESNYLRRSGYYVNIIQSKDQLFAENFIEAVVKTVTVIIFFTALYFKMATSLNQGLQKHMKPKSLNQKKFEAYDLKE
jgi:hypothetical protein